eukprot:UN23003
MLLQMEDGYKIIELRGLLAKLYPHLETYRSFQSRYDKNGCMKKQCYLFAKYDKTYHKLKEILPMPLVLKVCSFIRCSYLGFSNIALTLEDVSNASEIAEKLPLILTSIKAHSDTPQSLVISWIRERTKSELKDYPHIKFCLKKVGRETNQLLKNLQLRTGIGK